MRNVEFKAEIRDLEAARLTCEVVGAVRAGTLVQVDTYFRTPDGRLKRRETEGQPPEWIFYQRPDQLGPRVSRYTLLTDGQARVRFGSGTLQAWTSNAESSLASNSGSSAGPSTAAINSSSETPRRIAR